MQRMKPGFWDYVRAAFNARPAGMFVPPNWVGLGAFGLLGLANPGFWVIGAGLELGYLYTLGTNKRFQRTVQANALQKSQKSWIDRKNDLLGRLDGESRALYRRLEDRCQTILSQSYGGTAAPSTSLKAQSDGLARLLWIYLKLLFTRQQIRHGVLNESSGDREEIKQRIADLETKLKSENLAENLKKSLSGQMEILQQRLTKRDEAQEKLDFLDAELTRIEEQAELIREQAVLSTDPDSVSNRIDEVTAALDGTASWIQQQQKLYGAVEDLMVDAPPISVGPVAEEA